MERLGTLPFVAQPGEKYVYGYNTDILGCIVEKASGVSLDEFFRTHITGPLGMKDTHFFLPAEKRERFAAVYGSDADGKAVRQPEGQKGQGHYVDGPRKSFPAARDWFRRRATMRPSSRRCAMAARSARCASSRRTPCSS